MSTEPQLLVVSESPIMREIYTAQLESSHPKNQVFQAADMAEAIERHREGQIAFMVTDYQLSKEKAPDLLRLLAEGDLPLPEVIVLSRHVDESLTQEIEQAGTATLVESGTLSANDLTQASSRALAQWNQRKETRGMSVYSPPLGSEEVPIGKYRAILMAAQDYEDKNFTDLKTPINDIESFGELLESHYGFSVDYLRNVTYEQIEDALIQLVQSKEENQSIILFFAGHGNREEFSKNEGYWYPVDTERGKTNTPYPHSRLVMWVKEMAARHVLVISDCCFSGSLFNTSRATPPTHFTGRYFLEKYCQRSRYCLTSSDDEFAGDRGYGSNSPFIESLVRALEENKNPETSIHQLMPSIREGILAHSAQKPLYGPLIQYVDNKGEFVFRRRVKKD